MFQISNKMVQKWLFVFAGYFVSMILHAWHASRAENNDTVEHLQHSQA